MPNGTWASLNQALAGVLRPWPLRGKHRLLDPWTAPTGTRQVRIQGSRFVLDLGELIQRGMYLGTFETHELRALARLLRPGDTFVDAGANVGLFTALASRAVGAAGRVVAFEPSPLACNRLRAMVAANQLGQVTVVEAALGAAPASALLYLGRGSTNHTPSLLAHADADVTPVEVRTLDEEAERLALGPIACLKIDVEGYEPEVLAGARQLLAAGRIRHIFCEFNPDWLARAGSSEAALAAAIESAGLRRVLMRGLPAHSPNRLYRLD